MIPLLVNKIALSGVILPLARSIPLKPCPLNRSDAVVEYLTYDTDTWIMKYLQYDYGKLAYLQYKQCSFYFQNFILEFAVL